VGNKADLTDRREVEEDTALQFAKGKDACPASSPSSPVKGFYLTVKSTWSSTYISRKPDSKVVTGVSIEKV
jgi:hypothetical protein